MGQVLIVGGGQAGFQLALSLRQKGFGEAVTLVCAERHLPYMRPPLSKGLMKGETQPADITFRTEDFFQEEGIRVIAGDPAAAIRPADRQVSLSSGLIMDYERLVLATGARARMLSCPGAGLGNIFALRTLDDACRIRQELAAARRVCVIGGGFIGLEFAAVAAKAGKQVTVLEAGERLMARALSPWMSQWFLALHRGHGVDIRLRETVRGFDGAQGVVRAVELSDGALLEADLVVVGIGVTADQDIATRAGIDTADGILTDACLRTNYQDIYAIGDCARFPSPFAASPVRLESVQNAVDQARHVADGIISGDKPFVAVPWFWSEQFEAKLQIAGLAAGYDDARILGDPDGRSFSVEYYCDERLAAVDSINDPRVHLAARKRIASDVLAAPAGQSVLPMAQGTGRR